MMFRWLGRMNFEICRADLPLSVLHAWNESGFALVICCLLWPPCLLPGCSISNQVTLKANLLLKLVGSAHSVEILDGHGYTEPAD